MKLSQSFIPALLALGAYAQDDDAIAAALLEAAAATDAAELADAIPQVVQEDPEPICPEGQTCPEYEKVCEKDAKTDVESCRWCVKKGPFDPQGPKCEQTAAWQYIFDQGAYSWSGFEIYNSTAVDKKVVGRLDGQTGWTGINQYGEKTMSYQIAIIIKAAKSLSDIFKLTKQGDESADQFGFWIPLRGEGNPPEKWQMNLVDVFLREPAASTKLVMRQSLYYRGLDLVVDDYKDDQFDETYNIADWQFNRATGVLQSSLDTQDSLKSKEDYWIPVRQYTTISDDRLVIAIEGTSLKQYLPEIRGGSSVPFYFQFIDYDSYDTSHRRRQLESVILTFHDDPNACNLPAVCELPDEEDEGAFSLTTTLAASLFALTSLLSF